VDSDNARIGVPFSQSPSSFNRRRATLEIPTSVAGKELTQIKIPPYAGGPNSDLGALSAQFGRASAPRYPQRLLARVSGDGLGAFREFVLRLWDAH
jgi:hypothetical protein